VFLKNSSGQYLAGVRGTSVTVAAFQNLELVRLEVLTATGMKIGVFWDIAPHNLLVIDYCFVITLQMRQ
jgi:hypothetical protein